MNYQIVVIKQQEYIIFTYNQILSIMKRNYLLFILSIFSISVFSQTNVSVVASKTTIAETESFEVTATLEAAIAEDAIVNFALAGTAKHDLDFTTAFLSRGTATTVAGGNGSDSTANQLLYPSHVSVDSDGNIYISDNSYIQKWVPEANEGIVIAYTGGSSGFFVDPLGNIYVALQSSHIVKKWAIGASAWITVAGGNGSGSDANQLDYPMGISVDAAGAVYIADKNNHRIQKWAVDATEGITVAGGNGEGTAGNQLYDPVDVSVNSEGDIFVLDQYNDRIQKWEPNAVTGSTVANLSGYFSYFFVDDDDRIFLSDRNNNRVLQWLSVTDQWITIAGGNDAGSDANQLSAPLGISLDNEGNLLVADRTNNRIQRVQYAPQITILAGETEGKITIAGIDDNADEYEETIIVTPTNTSNCTLSSSDPIAVTITDNDEMPSVSFSFSADKIKENSATDVSLIATPSIVSGKDIEIVFTIEGDAVETEEYVLSSRNITILAGDTVGRLSISTNGLDDALVEVLKTITFRVNSIDNATAETEAATLYYESDDDPAVTIASSKIIIAEHESSEITATLETATSKDAIIDFEFDGTAIQDLDYTTAFLSKGIATTVAGGNGYGSASNQLSYPIDISIDADGNMYILDNEYIKKWIPNADTGINIVSTNLGYARLFVDPLGNIYLSVRDNHLVKKWTVGASAWITVAGGNSGGSEANQLSYPAGIYVDADGNIYIADQLNHRVQKWADGATEGITVAGGNGYGSAANQLYEPIDVSVDTDGNIYVLDKHNRRIQKWAVDADTGITVANTSRRDECFYIDGLDRIFVADRYVHNIQQWMPKTREWIIVAGGSESGSDANQLNDPWGITFDKNGNLFVADRENHRIQKIQYAPQITVLAGETEGKFTISGIEDDLNNEGDESILVKTVSAENAVLETVEDISISLLDNTKTLTLQENPFIGLSNGAVSWGDYDRDGDMDVAVMGLSPLVGAITAVYENQDGTFVNTNQDFARLYDGDISWVDINKDGWIDLVVSGYNETVQTKLYLNNEGTFVATDDYGLPQLFSSKMAWGDLDNDGDIDLAIAGINEDEEYVFYIYYREDDQDNFIKEPNLITSYWSSTGWPGFINGDLKIVDLDLDGDNDVVFSGEDSNGNPVGGARYNTYIRTVAPISPSGYPYSYAEINTYLKNSTIEVARLQDTPYDSLSVISSGIDSYDNIVLKTSNFSGSTDLFPKLKNGDIAFGDFDNDGLNDIVFTGENDAGVPITELFLQNSNGGFRASEIVLQGLRNSTANWVDYDMDGDLDLFLTGLDDNGAKSLLYKAETVNKVNAPPTVISGLALEDLGNGNVRLLWNVPTDDFSTNLGYVVRLGTTSGGTELSNTESDLETGVRLISKPAPVYTNFIETQLDPGVYYWSVQAVDQGLKGGAFSEESSFMLTYEWKLLNQGGIVDKSINAYEDPVIRLADIDNDDDMDLIYGSTTNGQVQVFKYDGKHLINESNLFNVGVISDVEVGDVNGDGITDVLFNSINNGSYYLSLYISNGSNFDQTNIDNGLYKAKGRIVDLNNDGQAEVVLIGLSSNLSTGKVQFYIFEYDATSNPVFNKIDVSDQIASLSAASFDLGDIDNDQDIDLVMSGFSAAVGLKSYVYENVTEMSGSYQFVAIDNDLVATIEGTNNLIDFDGDGDLDVVITGTSIAGDVFEIYENQIIDGLSTWSLLDNTGLIPMRLGKVDLGDFNGDGYSDLLYSGVVGGSGKVSNLSEFNPSDNTFIDSDFDVSDIIDADVEFGDLEGDGDLDFAISGESRTESGKYIFRAYVNVRNESAAVIAANSTIINKLDNNFKDQMEDSFSYNEAPDVPVSNEASGVPGAVANAKGIPVALSWNAAADDHTPFGGVTYAVKVGRAPGGEDVMSSNSNSNGKRKTARKGNAEHNLKWKLRLPSGTYYWSVQAIDASFAGSEFTEPKMFQLSDALGVNDQNLSKDLLAYPNPTRGDFEVQIPGTDSRVVLIIRNPLGKKVSEQNLSIEANRKVKLNISSLSEGIYFVTVKASNSAYTFKIAKE